MTVITPARNPFRDLAFIDLWRMIRVASAESPDRPLSVRQSKHLAGQLQGGHGEADVNFERYQPHFHDDPTGEHAVRAVLRERGY